LAPGTSPDISRYQETAFQGSNGHLWTLDGFAVDTPPIDTGLAMKPGTSPTVVPLDFG
jgi:hypothetical protein